MTATVLPPTSHDLPASQHARLVRSNRKLQAVLGATPQIIESTTAASRRNFKKLALSLAPCSGNRGQVVLNITSTPRHHHNRTISVLSITSNTGTGARPCSTVMERAPLSPLPPCMTRRRRMAKLTRTLGENIPPELVGTVEKRAPLPQRKSIPNFDAPPPPTHSSDDEDSESDSDDDKFVPLPEIIVPEVIAIPPRVTKTQSMPVSPGKFIKSHPARSTSLHNNKQKQPKQHRRQKTEGWAHRREAGWSGEWNTPDHDEILRRLRRL
ncbi:hypothetical protein CYLTODRAFT_427082 [Cylindrobasidium torrendii FP15055 ss-10]|uniref:Uncharacterized protein n=1 Tax=Cylindrobasidium torrendii FP15055 ss-10 TaxID=1314674 RepID=A0A0D7AY66_9AGAR|nr:hypothetical protein CYLTODRAFT_427082 [Cylindrobasidium torrendii FP15055 ss-10]